MLNGPGSQKIQVIKAVRELTGLGLKDKALVDEAPKPIKEDVSKEDAEAALEDLKKLVLTPKLNNLDCQTDHTDIYNKTELAISL